METNRQGLSWNFLTSQSEPGSKTSTITTANISRISELLSLRNKNSDSEGIFPNFLSLTKNNRLLAESMASEGNPYQGDDLEIVSDEQLQQAKKDTIMNEPKYANYRERKDLHHVSRIRTGERVDGLGASGAHDKDVKKQRIEDSIKRLGSPPRRYQLGEVEIRKRMAQEEDLIYSIKMTHDEYEQYQNARNHYKQGGVARDSPQKGSSGKKPLAY
jgi:hypothetical protein